MLSQVPEKIKMYWWAVLFGHEWCCKLKWSCNGGMLTFNGKGKKKPTMTGLKAKLLTLIIQHVALLSLVSLLSLHFFLSAQQYVMVYITGSISSTLLFALHCGILKLHCVGYKNSYCTFGQHFKMANPLYNALYSEWFLTAHENQVHSVEWAESQAWAHSGDGHF